jgi:hypothetical protein
VQQKKEPERPKPEAPVTRNLSEQHATAPVELTVSVPEMTAESDVYVPMPIASEMASTNSLIAATELIETALHKHDQTGEQLAVAKPAPPQATDIETAPPPSPHAGIVAQLEAWLRTIESRRRNV